MHVYRSNLQSDFPSSPTMITGAALQTSLNQLEWTESQLNGFNEYIYTSGQQRDVCVSNNGQLLIVSTTYCRFTSCSLLFCFSHQKNVFLKHAVPIKRTMCAVPAMVLHAVIGAVLL